MRRLPPAPVFCLAALLPFAARPARALQAAPGDHAAHHRFVLPSFTFEDGNLSPRIFGALLQVIEIRFALFQERLQPLGLSAESRDLFTH